MAAWKLLINGVIYKSYRKLRFTKERNKLGFIEFVIFSANATDYNTNISYNKKIILQEYNPTTSIYDEIFKGYIRTVEKISYNQSKITGFTPAIKLFDRSWDSRQDFTNTATNDILTSVASGILDIGINTVTNVITTRFELDNKLRSVAKIANVNNAEWWESEDGIGNDQINLASSRYSNTSIQTITVGRSCNITEDKIDNEKIYNCINTIGKGDGINQVYAFTYGFCFYQPELVSDITANIISLNVTDSTGLASTNGIIYINNEKILYANRTGTNLYNLTRGYGGTIAVTHSAGMRVWYAGTTTTECTKESPATNSSVDIYGIREYTYYDKRIIRDIASPVDASNPLDSNESCGVICTRLWDRFNTPVRTITIRKRRTYLGDLVVGKTITVVDSTTGLNEDFKIYSLEMINDRIGGVRALNIVVNNLEYNFSTDLDELKKDMDTSGLYEQGATNIFTVDQAENCDVAHPLKLRFYLPADTKAVNKVLLNFKTENYRTYLSSGTTSYGSSGSVVQDAAFGGGGITIAHPNQWNDYISITTANDDCEGVHMNFDLKYFAADTTVYDKGSTGVVFMWRVVDNDGNYYPISNGSAGGIIAAGAYWNNDSFDGGNISLYIPGNQKDKTFTLQVQGQDTPDEAWYWYVSASYMTFERHTHSVTYGIGEPDPITEPLSVGVTVNGTTVSGSPFTTNDNTGIDITSEINDIGADSWVEIEFTPNQNLRIEASASIQIYIESTV